MTTPNIGDYGLTATYGNWRDRAAAWLIRYGTNSPVNHAFVYIGDGHIIEARPGGAAVAPVTKYSNITWSTGRLGVTPRTGGRILIEASKLLGTPYGWADIIAIALAQPRVGRLVNSRTWWVKRIQRDDRVICSQLVDIAYSRAGVHLFTDGRLPGLVSPGDLYNRLNGAA